jgi:hypothetical protein
VLVDSVEEIYTPIHMESARPAISYNTILSSADAAISGNPNSFYDDGLRDDIAFIDRRLGPDVHDNTLITNSVNGLFVRIRTQSGNPIDRLDLPARFDDIDVPHVISENFFISGTPGGSVSPGADRDPTTMEDARLRIDPGMIVKLSGSRIEARIGGQFIAEGTPGQPIIFTSLKDDKYGGSGTFDTNGDAGLPNTAAPAPGDWGGIYFGANSSGSLDFTRIFYAGGRIPIEGNFEEFNALEIHQADVRVANSIFQFNDDGFNAANGVTDRNGRGPNAEAVIFVRGAQPVIINNILRDNSGPVISINANAMQETVLSDYGRTTGAIDIRPHLNDNGLPLYGRFNDNRGPLVRMNRMIDNGINGMEVRGGTLTTETVWDDTDIAHILRNEIIVLNHHVFSGLRIQSSAQESLVVKLLGASAGFSASGVPLDIDDRIGGTVHIVGQPSRPVELTSLHDDSVPACPSSITTAMARPPRQRRATGEACGSASTATTAMFRSSSSGSWVTSAIPMSIPRRKPRSFWARWRPTKNRATTTGGWASRSTARSPSTARTTSMSIASPPTAAPRSGSISTARPSGWM